MSNSKARIISDILDENGLIKAEALSITSESGTIDLANLPNIPDNKIESASDWNSAFAWGDHAQAGYQDAATAITTSNIASQTVANADALTTPRNIALSGDVTGSVSFDGSSNVSITATVADDSHNHIIGNVDGLQDALDHIIGNVDGLQDALDAKVDTVVGKGLSTEDYTTAEKSKLAGIESSAQVNTVDSVAGKTGIVTLNKTDVGLANVDNTSDLNKPVSTATQTALNAKVAIVDIINNLTSNNTDKPLSANQGLVLKNAIDNINSILTSDDTTLDELQEIVDYIKQNRQTLDALGISNIAGLQTALDAKVDKITGKGLSTEDYTTAEKSKLAGIEAGAQVNVATNLGSSGTGGTRTITSSTGTNTSITYTAADVGAAAASHTHSAADITSGTLSVARGGTGATTFTSGNVLVGAGTGAVTTLSRSGIDSRSSFPPSAHTHVIADVTGLQGALDGKQATLGFTPVNKAGDTITGGLTISGSISSGAGDYGYYQSAGTNLILKGDSLGRSSIFFESEKDGTNINHPSDYGFIQFHSYGFGGTSGESNKLVIGVANDSDDEIVLQTPYDGGVKVGYRNATSGTGLTLQTVLHSGNYNSYSPTLTGGGASGTWGINITGNAATITSQANSATITASTGVDANNIVRRDGNGYIYANHINFSTSESENPTISSFITSNGDGWSRKSSLAHVKNQIRGVADGTWGINITGSAGSASTATNSTQLGGISSNRAVLKRRTRIHASDGTTLNSSISAPEMGFTYGGSGEPVGPFIAFGGLGGDIDYSCQLVGQYNSGGNDFKIRTRNDDVGSWNAWRTILTDGNYNSYAPTKTGGGASGTWGISVTGNAGSVTNGLYTTGDQTKAGRLMIDKGVHAAGANDYHLELYAPAGAATGEISLRFHQGGRWYQQIRNASGGFRFTQGADNSLVTIAAGSVFGDIFYDNNNTAFYFDGASNTNINDLSGNGKNIFRTYDSFLRINESSSFSSGCWFGGTLVRGDGFYAGSNGGTSTSRVHIESGSYNGIRVIHINGSDGSIATTGNITAYASDARLKLNVVPIDNAIKKIMSIGGYTFDWSDKAEELGFIPDFKIGDSGVLAQEIQRVLPQAVAPAPFDWQWDEKQGKNASKSGEDYLTVRYDRIVPLLIEAIKEQQTQIEALTSEINTLKEKIK